MEHLKAKEKEILNHLDNFGLEFPKLDKFFRDVHKFYDSVLDIVATNEAKFDEQGIIIFKYVLILHIYIFRVRH